MHPGDPHAFLNKQFLAHTKPRELCDMAGNAFNGAVVGCVLQSAFYNFPWRIAASIAASLMEASECEGSEQAESAELHSSEPMSSVFSFDD